MCCQCQNLAGCFFFRRLPARLLHGGIRAKPRDLICLHVTVQTDRPVHAASRRVRRRCGEQLHLLSPISVHSGAQMGHRQDTLYVRRRLKAVTVQSDLIWEGVTSSAVHWRQDSVLAAVTVNRGAAWDSPLCASVCARFECGHSESERPKWKERGPLSHLRSFWPCRFFVSFLCPAHGYLSAWGHNAPRRTLFKACESWSAAASKDTLG